MLVFMHTLTESMSQFGQKNMEILEKYNRKRDFTRTPEPIGRNTTEDTKKVRNSDLWYRNMMQQICITILD